MKGLVVGTFYAVFFTVVSVGVQALDVRDVNERVAVYEYLRGNKETALIEMAIDSGLALGEGNKFRRDLFRAEQLHRTLSDILGEKMPQEVNDRLWLDISELRRRAGDCEGALLALLSLKQLDVDMEFRRRFQQIACMLQQDIEPKVLIAAEKIAIKDQKDGELQQSLWQAYIYNNLAVAAQSIDQPMLAQAYFNRALQYVDNTKEGKALKSYLQLNLAYSYFSENRFDFAQKTFALLREDSEWLDRGLLGFGWAAFNNNQPGLALESWRQLAKLPFKSINVYEGYLAIPYAFERQNAMSEAYHGYEYAINEYLAVTKVIEDLQENLLIEDIQAHLDEYFASAGEGAAPIHPLLVYAYAQPSFQDVIDTVGKTQRYLERIDQLQVYLDGISESYQLKSDRFAIETNILEAKEMALKKKIDELDTLLDKLVTYQVSESLKQLPSSDPFKVKATDYLALAMAKKNQDQADTLALVRGLILGRLQEERVWQAGSGKTLDYLVMRLLQVKSDLLDYKNQKAHRVDSDTLGQRIYLLQQQLATSKAHILTVKNHALELMLGKTLETLAQQKKQIRIYEDQARISLTRISENFYQQGGQRLWK
ncbi:MAG: hypothetical protein OXE99_09460 [Cellvibrionales bacterium]|nr:hypothetical protein [Cellvibrionales bacterium]